MIGDGLYLENTDIHYCTYADAITGKIPATAVLFVDEIDSFFFSDKPLIFEGKIISTILLLNKHKVVGMTATFRGDQGQAKLSNFLNDSVVLKVGTVVPNRVLALDVYGKLSAADVEVKVAEVAKLKQADLPVIIILPSIAHC